MMSNSNDRLERVSAVCHRRGPPIGKWIEIYRAFWRLPCAFVCESDFWDFLDSDEHKRMKRLADLLDWAGNVVQYCDEEGGDDEFMKEKFSVDMKGLFEGSITKLCQEIGSPFCIDKEEYGEEMLRILHLFDEKDNCYSFWYDLTKASDNPDDNDSEKLKWRIVNYVSSRSKMGINQGLVWCVVMCADMLTLFVGKEDVGALLMALASGDFAARKKVKAMMRKAHKFLDKVFYKMRDRK